MNINTRLRDRTYRASCASLGFLSASSIAIPICLVAISKEFGFSLTQGGALGLMSSVMQFILLIASSVLAARFGKIRLLRVGLFTLAVGLFLFILSKSWIHAALLMLIIGAGSALLDGLLTPIVEDLFPNDDGTKMNLLHAFWPMGTFVCVLSFGELLTSGVSWRFLFVSLAIILTIVMFWYPSSRKIPLPQSRADFSHMGEILRLPRFWILGSALGLAGGAEAAFAFWSASYIQISFNALPRAGAFGVAAFAVGMAVGRLYSSKIAGKIGLRRLMLISLVAGVLVSSSFFLIQNLLSLYLFLVVIGLCVASLWPSIQSYAAAQLRVDATVLMIFLSCFGLPGFSAATFIMGVIGDARGLRTSFIVAPINLTIALVLLLVDSRLARRKQKTI
ncbi:MAG TPA: MFS transporter [Treponema sp.]|nr:MFS transporter [Treponema sp.]